MCSTMSTGTLKLNYKHKLYKSFEIKMTKNACYVICYFEIKMHENFGRIVL